MNIDSTPVKKNQAPMEADDFSFEDFDFKPITSGLGFNQNKTTEVKPAFTERVISQPAMTTSRPAIQKDNSYYQNDLSLFYNQQQPQELPPLPKTEERVEKVYRLASKPQRVFAYTLDLAIVLSALGIVLTIMARTIDMDLMFVWQSYPNEVTPLVLTLFCGFYLIYFSIFEKTGQCTIGKNLLNLRVVDQRNKMNSFSILLLRSFITLVNFVSLGLFSYFDLQNKVTQSKVIRVD